MRRPRLVRRCGLARCVRCRGRRRQGTEQRRRWCGSNRRGGRGRGRRRSVRGRGRRCGARRRGSVGRWRRACRTRCRRRSVRRWRRRCGVRRCGSVRRWRGVRSPRREALVRRRRARKVRRAGQRRPRFRCRGARHDGGPQLVGEPFPERPCRQGVQHRAVVEGELDLLGTLAGRSDRVERHDAPQVDRHPRLGMPRPVHHEHGRAEVEGRLRPRPVPTPCPPRRHPGVIRSAPVRPGPPVSPPTASVACGGRARPPARAAGAPPARAATARAR